jgi:hypothetical protein
MNVFSENIPIDLHKADTNISSTRSMDKDLQIISEKNTIDIIGKKASFIVFSITKEIKFKVLSKQGIADFSKFTLPGTFDPSYIPHAPIDRNITYAMSDLISNYFNASITTKIGAKKEAVIKKNIEGFRMVRPESQTYGRFNKYIYQIENLEIGDEVVVKYNYDLKYIENFAALSSFRVFFHDSYFKENYQLILKHHPNLSFEIDYKNGAEPDSIHTTDEELVYYWDKTNLNPCMKEKGGRPYMSLPYFVFTVMPYELLYTLPYSFEEQFVPFYALFSSLREENHLDIARSVSQGVTSRQYSQINKFVKGQTQDILSDSLGDIKLQKIHNTIVEDFKFDNDIPYFKKADTRDVRIGDYVSKQTIRDIGRYDLYVALLYKLDLFYFTAYLSDVRSGEISDKYFAPMYDSDYLFAVFLTNNNVQFLYPKKSDFGYYLNEIPFYFERSKARLVSLNDYQNYKVPINQEERLIDLPGSNVNENARKSFVQVMVNLDSLTAVFDARITLCGQYSTLTRGLYQLDYKDETVNKLYNKKIWEIDEKVQLIDHDVKVKKKVFPFTTAVNAQYKADNLISKRGDTLSLDLKNCFNHIIYKDLKIEDRQLDFYPDFSGCDTYAYFVQFDKNIKLLKSFKDVEIKNNFGELVISVDQVNANTIKVASHFKSVNNKIVFDEIDVVKEIYNKIEELNNFSLLFLIE